MTIIDSTIVLPVACEEAQAAVIVPVKPKYGRHHEAGPCEGPGCMNTVPAGKLARHQFRLFCSASCCLRAKNLRRKNNKKHVGTCEYCHGPILASGGTPGKHRFCSVEHFRAAQNDSIMLPTGPLGQYLVEYTILNPCYAGSTLFSAKANLAQAARFFNGNLGIERWEDVRPASITQFTNHEKARGIKSTNTIGQLSTFFNWLITAKGFKIQNPVIRKFHKQKSRRNDPRPLEDEDIALGWEILTKNGDPALMLAFAIGEECGLRGGETCNIRLSDVDTVHRKIHVRLPTKNDVERDVPYHDRVDKCLDLWKQHRNPDCGHDHLLHGPRNAPLNIHSLDERFSRVFSEARLTGGKFTYHRLRHTWASRLYDNGMDLATLQKLGGWQCLATLQVYVQVRKEKIERQYQQAYEVMKQRKQEPADTIISMEQFLKMTDGK